MSSESISTPIAEDVQPTPTQESEGYVRDFVFLSDQSHVRVVSVSQDVMHDLKWNCDMEQVVRNPWSGKVLGINALALSPDEKIIACGRRDGSVQRWKSNREMIKDVWKGHSEEVRALSWSPSGDKIASGSKDGTILIRIAANGAIEREIHTEQGWVYSLAYSFSGDRIASGGWNTTCIWDTETGKFVG